MFDSLKFHKLSEKTVMVSVLLQPVSPSHFLLRTQFSGCISVGMFLCLGGNQMYRNKYLTILTLWGQGKQQLSHKKNLKESKGFLLFTEVKVRVTLHGQKYVDT